MKRVLLATAMGVGFASVALANPVFFNGPVNGQVTVKGNMPILCGAYFTLINSDGAITGSGNSYTVDFGDLDPNNDGFADGGLDVTGNVSVGCNTKATLTVDNANPASGSESGLYNPATGGAGFTNFVEYNLVVGPIASNSLPLSAPGVLTHNWATPFIAMNAPLSLTTVTGTLPLVAGNYQDTIYVTLTPSL